MRKNPLSTSPEEVKAGEGLDCSLNDSSKEASSVIESPGEVVDMSGVIDMSENTAVGCLTGSPRKSSDPDSSHNEMGLESEESNIIKTISSREKESELEKSNSKSISNKEKRHEAEESNTKPISIKGFDDFHIGEAVNLLGRQPEDRHTPSSSCTFTRSNSSSSKKSDRNSSSGDGSDRKCRNSRGGGIQSSSNNGCSGEKSSSGCGTDDTTTKSSIDGSGSNSSTNRSTFGISGSESISSGSSSNKGLPEKTPQNSDKDVQENQNSKSNDQQNNIYSSHSSKDLHSDLLDVDVTGYDAEVAEIFHSATINYDSLINSTSEDYRSVITGDISKSNRRGGQEDAQNRTSEVEGQHSINAQDQEDSNMSDVVELLNQVPRKVDISRDSDISESGAQDISKPSTSKTHASHKIDEVAEMLRRIPDKRNSPITVRNSSSDSSDSSDSEEKDITKPSTSKPYSPHDSSVDETIALLNQLLENRGSPNTSSSSRSILGDTQDRDITEYKSSTNPRTRDKAWPMSSLPKEHPHHQQDPNCNSISLEDSDSDSSSLEDLDRADDSSVSKGGKSKQMNQQDDSRMCKKLWIYSRGCNSVQTFQQCEAKPCRMKKVVQQSDSRAHEIRQTVQQAGSKGCTTKKMVQMGGSRGNKIELTQNQKSQEIWDETWQANEQGVSKKRKIDLTWDRISKEKEGLEVVPGVSLERNHPCCSICCPYGTTNPFPVTPIPSTHMKHTCEVCGQKFDKKSRLKAHRAKFQDLPKNGERFKCAWCTHVFKTRMEVANHKRVHMNQMAFKNDQNVPKIHTDIFKGKKQLREMPDGKHFESTFCSHTFTMKDALGNHEKAHKSWMSSVQDGTEKAIVRMDKTYFKDRTEKICMEDKLDKAYSEDMDTPSMNVWKDKPYFKDVMDKTHMNERMDKTYNKGGIDKTCNECGQKFFKPSSLRRHIEYFLTDLDEKIHKCFFCNHEFKTEPARNLHERVHGNDRRLPCCCCSRRFLSRYKLHLHSKKMGIQWPPICKLCSTHFTTKKNLKDHLKAVTRPLPFSCYVCRHNFQTEMSLIRHLNNHKMRRKYECPACLCRFGTKKALIKHIL